MNSPSASLRPALGADSAARIVRVLFAVGLLFSLAMVWRSQVGGDQLNLLARGWRLYNDGVFIPYGNPMSTGGKAPGGITTLLVGLPLFAWPDHRAATLVVLLFHVLAYLLLDRTLRPHLTPAERVGLALLYWLNPWRVYFSGFLWNPNFLFLMGALHLWSAMAQRAAPRFLPSFVHAAALALAFQIHASFLLLAVASLLLWWRGAFRVHWGGLFLGGALAALPLIPWLIDLQRNPAILTEASKGFLGRGFVLVFPLVRGLFYWFRYASLAVAGRAVTFDFTGVLGAHPGLDRGLTLLAQIVPAVTILLPLWAGRRLWRKARGLLRRRLDPGLSPRTWLKGYALYGFLACFVVFGLSPTTTMMWQGLILLHAAILPPLLSLGPLWRTRFAPRWALAAKLYLGAELFLLAAMTFGAPQYRCQGHEAGSEYSFPLRSDHPMLHALHIHATCPWPTSGGTWFPDVLEPAPAAAKP